MAEGNRNDLTALGRIRHDTEINLSLDQVFIDFVRPQVLQMDVNLGVRAQEFGQIRRQLMQTDAVDGTYPNRTGDHRPDLTQAILEFNEAANDLLARVVKNLTGRGRFDTCPSAL